MRNKQQPDLATYNNIRAALQAAFDMLENGTTGDVDIASEVSDIDVGQLEQDIDNKEDIVAGDKPVTETLLEFMDKRAGYLGQMLTQKEAGTRELIRNISEYLECWLI